MKLGSLVRTVAWPAVFVGIVAGLAVTACTSKNTVTVVKCDPTKCVKGNECISNGTDEQCRLPCTSNDICPFNYHCYGDPNAPKAYCAEDKTKLNKAGQGQWGFPCNPQHGGIMANTDCDTAQQFGCYAKAPTDGAAFCTRFDCAADDDCKGGYFCATLNTAPNAEAANPSWGNTRSVCIPRDYCAPCNSEVDCGLDANGVQQHCIGDANGGKYCGAECQGDSTCRIDARCLAWDADNTKNVCVPRAGVCIGDGKFCSPCRSDKDCSAGGGVCADGEYTHERFCTVKSGVHCVLNGNTVTKDCPARAGTENWKGIGCTTSNSGTFAPVDQCFGVVSLSSGGNNAPGCWSRNR